MTYKRLIPWCLILVLAAAVADARTTVTSRKKQKRKSRVVAAVKRNPVLRVHFVARGGKQIPVVTNLKRPGMRAGRQIPESEWREISWRPAVVYRVPASGTRVSSLTNTQPQPAVTGIPVPSNRNPQRPINPLKAVNPFEDPTAIPTRSTQR